MFFFACAVGDASLPGPFPPWKPLHLLWASLHTAGQAEGGRGEAAAVH